jgi:putative hemolysin
MAAPMLLLSRLTSPLVRLLSISSNLVLRLLGAKPSDEPPVTEEEIKVMIEQGTQAGVFAEAEQDMVQAVFRLADRRVGTLMTPRTDVVWLDLDDTLEENQRKIFGSAHSRFPVAEGSLDHVVGVVLAKDLLSSCITGKTLDLREVLLSPMFVPESMPALHVLEQFRESRIHTALVIDEYGGFQGLVTLFDILESIVGEIPDAGDLADLEVTQREDGTWLVDGMLPVDELKEIFHLSTLPGEERGYYQTVGGFMMTFLGRIPVASDHFIWSDLRFEVVDMDGLRVDKILIVPQSAREEE